MRNSWGKWWGEDGYMWIEYGANNIGEMAVWATPESPGSSKIVKRKRRKLNIRNKTGSPIEVQVQYRNGTRWKPAVGSGKKTLTYTVADGAEALVGVDGKSVRTRRPPMSGWTPPRVRSAIWRRTARNTAAELRDCERAQTPIDATADALLASDQVATEPSMQAQVLTLPFSMGLARWQPSLDERRAAYALYVELNHLPGALSRVRDERNPLPPRLVLQPFAEVGHATRRVLAKAGRRVADCPSSFGQLALKINRTGFRPFVERWGTRLAIHDAARPLGMARTANDLLWPEGRNFISEAEHYNGQLEHYIEMLAGMAGISLEQRHTPSPGRSRCNTPAH